MRIDLAISPAGMRVVDVLATASAAEDCGFDGVALSDTLNDPSSPDGWSPEIWTLMSAIATRTERVEIGSLVLNIANRDAGTLAVAAATLQELSQGRLWLGIGAGGGATSEYAADQRFLGRTPPSAAVRRARLVDYIDTLRRVWTEGPTTGFLRPDPAPAVVVSAFGAKTAALAGRVADGVACPFSGFGPEAEPFESLIQIARDEFDAAGREGRLLTVVHYDYEDSLLNERWATGSEAYERFAGLDIDRVIVAGEVSADAVYAAAPQLPLGGRLR